MDKGREEVITRSNSDIIGEDIVKEHCYVGINTKKVFDYHLSDHNYILKRKPENTANAAETRKLNIKIKELRAVYNCTSCGYRTMDRELFAKHSCGQTQAKNPVYNCKSCGYHITNRELFAKHSCGQTPAKKKKKVVKHVECTKCDINKAPEGYQKCTKCTYFTKNKSSLKVHMWIHAKPTPYKCTECDFSGKDLKDLITHYEETKDSLKCDCGYTTHVKQQMVSHKLSHTEGKQISS